MTDLRFRLTALLICSLLAAACQREEPPPATSGTPQPSTAAIAETPPSLTPPRGNPGTKPSTAVAPAAESGITAFGSTVFMEQGIALVRGETVADALPVWRRFTAQKPALLLFSSGPALLSPPNELRPQIDAVMATGTDAALRQAGNPLQPAPLFLPAMTVDLALHQGWLRELVWTFPQIDPTQEMKLETLREQLSDNHMVNDEETATLKLADKILSGRLRGRPFRAAALPNLPKLDGPLIVHFDLSYFQQLYKNDVTTPVIPLVGGILQQLKERKLAVLAVTFSYNHVDGNIPLNVRFVGDFISALVEKPERLNQPLPRRWAIQKDILYLENFFQRDEIRKLVEQQAQESPNTSWVQFNRYHTAGLFKEGDKALQHLAKAVALDRMYAIEYFPLAQRALENQASDQALRLMKMAGAAFPDNPLLKLQIAELAMEVGEKKTARMLVKELQNLPWSPVYYPNMSQYLERFMVEAEK